MLRLKIKHKDEIPTSLFAYQFYFRRKQMQVKSTRQHVGVYRVPISRICYQDIFKVIAIAQSNSECDISQL